MKNFILILCLATFSQWVYAQNKQITGRVVDTKGEAAIGASILEKGTTNGTITDFDGNFKLTVGPKVWSELGCGSQVSTSPTTSSQQDETEYHYGGRHGSAG